MTREIEEHCEVARAKLLYEMGFRYIVRNEGELIVSATKPHIIENEWHGFGTKWSYLCDDYFLKVKQGNTRPYEITKTGVIRECKNKRRTV